MGRLPDSRSEELAQLQIQLANVSRLLDELERRSFNRRTAVVSDSQTPDLPVDSPETRFAACVASGMSKIQAAVRPKK